MSARLDLQKNHELELHYESDDQFIDDMIWLIALEMSVLDVPNLTTVCRFLANRADKLWQHHTLRLFGHPDKSVHSKTDGLNSYDLFFMNYYRTAYPARRHALQIKDGMVDIFIKENSNLTIYDLFLDKSLVFYMRGGFSFFRHSRVASMTLNESLFMLIHGLPHELRKVYLDHFHDCSLDSHKAKNIPSKFESLKYPAPDSVRSYLRKALDIPTLTLNKYIRLKNHLVLHENTPLIRAIEKNDPELLVIMLQCGADLDEKDKQDNEARFQLFKYVCVLQAKGRYKDDKDDLLLQYIFKEKHDCEQACYSLPFKQ